MRRMIRRRRMRLITMMLMIRLISGDGSLADVEE
jgi:hypothetical protein